MIKFRFYRAYKVFIRGCRSFVKRDDIPNGQPTSYAMISGRKADVEKIVTKLLDEGFVEEWPLKPDML